MTNPNDPIYPLMSEMVDKVNSKGVDIYYTSLTLSKREYFAAMAMQGILANGPTDKEGWDLSAEQTAQVAVKHADALINQLNKTSYEYKPKPNDGGA